MCLKRHVAGPIQSLSLFGQSTWCSLESRRLLAASNTALSYVPLGMGWRRTFSDGQQHSSVKKATKRMHRAKVAKATLIETQASSRVFSPKSVMASVRQAFNKNKEPYPPQPKTFSRSLWVMPFSSSTMPFTVSRMLSRRRSVLSSGHFLRFLPAT